MTAFEKDQEKIVLGAASNSLFGAPVSETAAHIRQAGFSEISLVWDSTDRTASARDALSSRAVGLRVTSIHGPYAPRHGAPGGVDAVWQTGAAGDAFADVIMDCIEDAAAAQIPIVVLHPSFDTAPPASVECGISRFARIGAHAAALGVKLALENMEMPQHLTVLLDTLPPSVFGLCWDSGHNFAYTPEFDPLARYSGRVLTVHLHDNDGKRTIGAPHTRDDEHFLPFDGRIDWERAMARLSAARYDGPIMLEVKRGRAPCRNIPAYTEMGEARFFAEAYRRACRLSSLFADASEDL